MWWAHLDHEYLKPRETRERISRFPGASSASRTETEASTEHSSPFCVRMKTKRFRIRDHGNVENCAIHPKAKF